MYHSRFKGTHYNAGYKYGSLLKNHNMILDHCPTFTIDNKRVQFMKQCIPIYKEYYPEILEEIKGIADGNHADYEFLLTMLLSMYCYDVDNKCSCFAFSNKQNIIFGRNSDFLVSLEKLYTNVIYSLNNTFAFNGNTTALVEIEDGVNEYGLAIGLTFIASHKINPGLNSGMLVRYLLEKCKTTHECIEQLKVLPIATAQTLTIADSLGEIVVIECNCEKKTIIDSNNSNVYATNIFVSNDMKKYNIENFDNWRAIERYETMNNAFKNKPNYSLEYAKDILSGKYGFICQYDRKTNADTVWSVIYDLKNKEIHRVEGNPSRKKYKTDNRFKFKKNDFF